MSLAGKSRLNFGLKGRAVVNQMQIFRRENQGAAQRRFPRADRGQLEDIVAGKEMVRLEEAGEVQSERAKSSPARMKAAVSPVGTKPPWVLPCKPPNSVKPRSVVLFRLQSTSRSWGRI